MMRIALCTIGVLLTAPALAQSSGIALAKKIESEKDTKKRRKLSVSAKTLSDAEKKAFVTYATELRKKKGLWNHLAYPLAKIGTDEALAELALVSVMTIQSEDPRAGRAPREAAKALTFFAGGRAIPAFLAGLRSSDRDTRSNHRESLTRYLADAVPPYYDAPLRALSRELLPLERRVAEARQEAEDDPDAKGTKGYRDALETQKLLTLITTIVSTAFAQTNHVPAHIRVLGGDGAPLTLATALARGVAERMATRRAPILRELRRARRMAEREAQRTGETFTPEPEEKQLEALLRKQPVLRRLHKAIEAEKSTLEAGLSAIADRADPELRVHLCNSLLEVRETLDDTWAKVLIPIVGSGPLKVRNAAQKALVKLTGAKLNQSTQAWRRWWEKQNAD